MVDPRLALLVFALLVILAALVLWPRRGWLARFQRYRRLSERVRVEDAVKYLFHQGATGAPVPADALAGALEIRRAAADELLARLSDLGLAEPIGTGTRLTEAGRTEALRIVRSHRLLEQYLADRTGIDPAEWHEVAEDREHELSPEEIERLAVRLGQPRYDPHGDPIPTSTGEMPASRGVLLGALAAGEAGRVVHLEDEPRAAYERLRALGLALGKSVAVRARGATATEVEVDGEVVSLPRGLEAAISVERTGRHPTARSRTLADLRPGETGRVLHLSSACHGAQRRRLLDLGVVPGTEIESELRSASGDPTAYRIRGALIALRRHQAEWIEIEDAVPSTPGVAA
ncbi:MAG: metal-dependent transcriptional regulator [Gemmatimonadales bacterium]|nr:metal-dependent transcriptional regulator [Gemmatimonadales bacterium]